MARANVAGLKTMTRRRVKSTLPIQDWPFVELQMYSDPHGLQAFFKDERGDLFGIKCPWKVGDLIYQKEVSWMRVNAEQQVCFDEDKPTFGTWKRRSSMLMPKWAARFWAEIISIRVERLKDISAEDAKKEGFQNRHQFFDKIAAINGAEAVEKNAWFWVIEYYEVKS
jgi:hypothetical protein